MLRVTRRAALAGLLAAGLAACSRARTPSTQPSAPGPTPSPPPSPTPTSSPTPAVPVDRRPRWPLTGRLLDHPHDARHTAVAVKVPDNQVEHPQRGIDEADVVFVELDGYRDGSGHSGTRLVPVFHSRMAADVSPVRSIRPVDIALLSPMDVIIGNTGAAPWVINYVKHFRAHVEGMLSFVNTLRTGSYGTDAARVYRYNGQTYYDRAIICHPAVLARQTKRFRSGPRQPYFPFATGQEQPSTRTGKRGRAVSVPYKGQDYRMSYRYDAKSRRYLRSMPWGPHVLVDGTRVTTDNVLVVHARQHYGKIFRGRGHEEPLHDVIDATGRFTYLHGGRYVSGTWRKAGVTKPFTFTLADGTPLRMAPGRTFVELPDVKADVRIG